jgi:hypothetical protein
MSSMSLSSGLNLDGLRHLSSSARNKGTDTIRKVVLKGYVRVASMVKNQRVLPLGIKPAKAKVPVNFVRRGVDRSRVHLIGHCQFLVQSVSCLWELTVKLHF